MPWALASPSWRSPMGDAPSSTASPVLTGIFSGCSKASAVAMISDGSADWFRGGYDGHDLGHEPGPSQLDRESELVWKRAPLSARPWVN